jgi:hypothetical protein
MHKIYSDLERYLTTLNGQLEVLYRTLLEFDGVDQSIIEKNFATIRGADNRPLEGTQTAVKNAKDENSGVKVSYMNWLKGY